jgi:hypothetical protein
MGEILNDLGYDQASLDACHVRQALAQQDISVCDQLSLRAARLGCQRRYAMYHGEPDRCPIEPLYRGRDPLCVAVALRDPSMCAAEGLPDREGLCRAIILRGERPCRVAHATLIAANRCARAASRWWSSLPPARSPFRIPFGFEPELTICLDQRPPEAGPDANAQDCRPNHSLLQHGLVLSSATHLIVGGRQGLPIGPREPLIELAIPLPPPELELPQEQPIEPDGASLWIDLEGNPISSAGQEVTSGHITIERFGLARGALIQGSFEAELTSPGRPPSQVSGSFRTFLRDVIAADTQDQAADAGS